MNARISVAAQLCAAALIAAVASTRLAAQPRAGDDLGITLDETREMVTRLGSGYPQRLPLRVYRTVLGAHHVERHSGYGVVVDRLHKAHGLQSFKAVEMELVGAQQSYHFFRHFGTLLERDRQLFSFGLGLAGNRAADPVEKAILKGAKKIVDPAFQAAKAMTDEALDRAVVRSIDPKYTEEALATFSQIAVRESPQEFDRAVKYLHTQFVKNDAFDKLPAEKKLEFVEAMQQRIIQYADDHEVDLQRTRVRLSGLEADVEKTISTVDGVRRTLKEVSRKQVEFAEKVYAHQEKIKSHLQALSSGIEKNAKQTAANTFRLDAITSAMYGQLPTRDKIEWVKSGLYPIPAGSKKEGELARLQKVDVMERQLAVVGEVQNYIEGGETIMDFAAAAGLDKHIVKVGREVFQKASVGTNVAKNLISGNYLGALGAVGSLIFGGGPDPAEVRHRELMDKLGVVDAKLDAVMRGQEEIYNAVVAVDEKVVKLTQLVMQNHTEVMEKLYDIEESVLISRELLLQMMENDLNKADNFLAIDDQPTHDLKAAFFREHRETYTDIRSSLGKFLGNPKPPGEQFRSVNAYFILRTNPQDPNLGPGGLAAHRAATAYLNGPVARSVGWFAAQFGQEGKDDAATAARRRAIVALSTPSPSVAALESKRATMPGMKPPEAFPYYEFDRTLNGAAVRRYSEVVLRFYPYFFIVARAAEPPRLMSESQLRDPKNFPPDDVQIQYEHAIKWLHTSAALTNLAIAQQAAIAGDILLADVAEKIIQKDLPPESVEALKQNPILARNALMYALVKRVAANGGNPLAYEFALSTKDPQFLQDLTRAGQSRLEFRHGTAKVTEDGTEVERPQWYVNVGGTELQVPSAHAFRDGRLEPTPEMLRLIELRDRLSNEIAAVEFRAGLPADQALAFNLMFIAPDRYDHKGRAVRAD